MNTFPSSVFKVRFGRGLLLWLASMSLAPSTTVAIERPSIVLILADDLGWQETGFSGSDFCETPNLDRLARQGMVFRQAYAAAGN